MDVRWTEERASPCVASNILDVSPATVMRWFPSRSSLRCQRRGAPHGLRAHP